MDDRHLGELARRARPRTACRRAAIHSACAAGAVLLLQGAVGSAQTPAPEAQAVPVFVTPEPQPVVAEAAAPAPSGSSMRHLFANTLAAVVQAAGTGMAMSLTQAIAGGLTGWFARRTPSPALAVPPPAGATPPYVSTQPIEATAPTFVGAQAMPTPFYDPRTGAATAADPAVVAASQSPAATGNAMFAGMAFEVHLQDAAGATYPVDPATHEFRSGDRFLVFYRPTLPGRMEIFNINPAGVQMRIDATEVAAGELAQLGPYEFSGMTGDEALRLVLTPCSTPQLVVATRDIVKVGTGTSLPVAAVAQPSLASCGNPSGVGVRGIRGSAVRTRDIRKVAVEGTTGFALDPVSAEERASGNVVPRELTIVFRHR